jgi:dihydroflavonol-4-reductase
MILVTGATGHLGNVLVRELLARGNKVRTLILPGEDCKELNGLEVERFEGDITRPETLYPALVDVDQVFHMAALVSIIQGQEGLLKNINVQGTRNMLEAARKAKVRRFIYTSSIHALARPPEGVTIDESLPFDPENPAGAYDRSKAEASLIVQEAARQGLNAVIVCPTGVIGPYDYRRSEMGEMVLEWMSRKINVVIEGFFDFVDVRDVACGHILAGETGQIGQTYILGGERIRVAQLAKLVKQVTGQTARLVKIPLSLALFATNFTQLYYGWTHTRPRFTRYSIETLVSNSVISSDKARRELGYTARSLQESIHDTVGWWFENRARVKASLRI